MRSMLVYAGPLHIGHHNLFPVHRAFGNDFAVWRSHKTLPPKLDAVATGRRFMTDPVWRSYITTYTDGYRICKAFVGDDPARFKRLLTEQLTPADIVAGT